MRRFYQLLALFALFAGPSIAQADSMCVEGNRCDYRYPSTGICQLWLSYTKCGPACVAGEVCDLEYSDGRCASYRVDAVCGDQCTKTEVCRLRYSDGRCAETEFEVSCLPLD